MTAVRELLAAKYYVDKAIFYSVNESSLLRLDADEKLKPDGQDSLILNSTLTSPKTMREFPTKLYVDGLHKSSRNRLDIPTVLNDQDSEF